MVKSGSANLEICVLPIFEESGYNSGLNMNNKSMLSDGTKVPNMSTRSKMWLMFVTTIRQDSVIT